MVSHWKYITGYEGRYSISNKGEVYSHIRNYILKQRQSVRGYYNIDLRDTSGNRRTLPVHRLVALEFIQNDNDLETVDHKDGNKLNNTESNLRWMTRGDNAALANEKEHKFVSPSGVVVKFTNLRKFCRVNNLNQGCMFAVNTGKRLHHKQWRACND